MEEDVLMHYGVKGMKWGVRKDKSKGNKPKKPASAQSHVKAPSSVRSGVKKAPQRKSISAMTDDELRQAIQRLRLEQDYKNFFKEQPKQISRGKRFINNIIDGGIDEIPKAAWKGIGKAVSNKFESKFGLYLAVPKYIEELNKQAEEERKREEAREEDERKKREARNK